MTEFQTVILGAGPSVFPQNEVVVTKLRLPLLENTSTLMECCVSEYSDSKKIVCAVNPIDFQFAREIASKISKLSVFEVIRPTKGALITLALTLGDLLDDLPIVVASVDGIVPQQVSKFAHFMMNSNFDGGAMVIKSDNPNLSYVTELDNKPIEFIEKRIVSSTATTGIFFFKNKQILLDSIEWVLLSRSSLNNNYYISSTLNRLIYDNKKVGLFRVEASQYFRFSTPEEYLISRTRFEEVFYEKR